MERAVRSRAFLLILAASSVGFTTPRLAVAASTYLPYLSLDSAVQLIPQASSDTDICSSQIIVPGGLPLAGIRAPNISVCENGVILTEPALLRSSLCVCRGEFRTCEDPGESIYAIAPFWSNINNVSATHNTSISYQVFEESNRTHNETLEGVRAYIYSQMVLESIQFFPTWVLVAHWQNVHPYIRPDVLDPRTNTFQAVLATDGTQTYAIFTYICSDLGWARAPNSFVASDCSFIGAYAGGSFTEYLPETTEYGLQIDSRTANTTRAASCSSHETTWNNFLFSLTPQRVVNVTAREDTVAVNIGSSVTLQYYISISTVQAPEIELQFVPECQCSEDESPHVFTCTGEDQRVTLGGGVDITVSCSAGRLNVTVWNVTEEALGKCMVSVITNETESDTDFTNLKLVEEVEAEELLQKTSDPSLLTSDDIASASSDLEDLQTAALTNENVQQTYLKIIDNLMQADGSSLIQSQIANSSSSRIIESLQQFTLNVELPDNVNNETYIFETYGIQIFNLEQNQLTERIRAHLGPLNSVRNITIPVNISFSTDRGQGEQALYVIVGNLDFESYRLSVVVYRQENLFQNTTNGTGVNITSAVVSVSSTAIDTPTFTMGFRTLPSTNEQGNDDNENENMQYGEVCSNFNTGGNGGLGAWSSDSCEEVQCSSSDVNYTCCECYTYGHFGLLLAVTPVVLERDFEVVLVVFSYIGAGVSILSLIILLTTYILAKKLRSSTSGKLLINLGVSLLGVYVFFIVAGHIRPYGDSYAVDIVCGFSSAILHYFMLVYFGWTAAEALNLYFSLVKIFETMSIRHYTLKAGLVVWVVPLGVVAISAGAGHTFYINDVYCRPVEWPFYFAFVLPIAVMLVFNCAMFARIMSALYKHTQQTDLLKKTDREGLRLKQTKQNTRYAIVLMTLFGLGWIFGLIATGYPDAPMAVTFTLQLMFCLFVSTQGLLLFIFNVLMSRDARDFWLNKLEKCVPAMKKYRVSHTQQVRMGPKKTLMKRVTGLFKPPKYSEQIAESSPDHTTSGTMERSGRMSSGITESFEGSYQMTTLPRSVQSTTTYSPTGRDHSVAIASDTTAGTDFGYLGIDFDKLSLRDDF